MYYFKQIHLQEASQLRHKVEELENTNEAGKKQIKDLQEKIKQIAKAAPLMPKGKLPTFMSKTLAGEKETDKKLKEFEREVIDLKKKILEKDKTLDTLQKSTAKSKYTPVYYIMGK